MKVLGLLLMYIGYAGITDYFYWRGWCKVFKTDDWTEALVSMAPKAMTKLKQRCWRKWQKDNADDPDEFNTVYSFMIKCARVRMALMWPWTWFDACRNFFRTV